MNTDTPEIDQINDTEREIDMRRRITAWQNQTINDLARERDEARAEMIRWMSIAEGRGRTEDEPDTQAELAEAYAKLDRILKLTIHDDIFWAIEEIARISGGESDCSVCGGCFMIPGTEPKDDIMNTPCPKCNSPSEDTGKAMAKLIRQRDEARGQRDRLAEALRECREDSVELLGERDWWKNEPMGGYQKRYRDTRDNIDRADDALQSLTPNELSNQ